MVPILVRRRRSAATLTERDGQAIWIGHPPVGLPDHGDPLRALQETVEILHTPRLPGLPPLTGGMVGFLGYDAVRRLERLPDTTTDDLGLPELTFLFATDLAALDHETGEIWLIANAVNWDDSDERVDEAWAVLSAGWTRCRPTWHSRPVVRRACRPAGAARAGPAAVECRVPRGGRACEGGDPGR